eukprot:1155758-Pelagomonas_calceolata.AAC.1
MRVADSSIREHPVLCLAEELRRSLAYFALAFVLFPDPTCNRPDLVSSCALPAFCLGCDWLLTMGKERSNKTRFVGLPKWVTEWRGFLQHCYGPSVKHKEKGCVAGICHTVALPVRHHARFAHKSKTLSLQSLPQVKFRLGCAGWQLLLENWSHLPYALNGILGSAKMTCGNGPQSVQLLLTQPLEGKQLLSKNPYKLNRNL